jgi:hypothetical protein
MFCTTRSLALAVLAAFAALPALLVAQPFSPGSPAVPRSQHGSVSQQIAATLITIAYDRPVARGRDLFGALVPWGKIWSPSANNAAVVTISTDVRVNDEALAAGTYTLWTEPGPERWIVIFNRAHPAFHLKYPADEDALRVEVVPREGAHMEALAFYFPVADDRRGELVLHWGRVVVPLRLDVP